MLQDIDPVDDENITKEKLEKIDPKMASIFKELEIPMVQPDKKEIEKTFFELVENAKKNKKNSFTRRKRSY